MLANVLTFPFTVRLATGLRRMTRQAAESIGMSPTNRWVWIGPIGLLLTFALAVFGLARSFGQVEVRAASRADAEERLIGAATELKSSMASMRAELLGSVESIRGSVAAQQRQVDRVEAKLEESQRSQQRIQELLDVESLKRENLERRIRAAGLRLD